MSQLIEKEALVNAVQESEHSGGAASLAENERSEARTRLAYLVSQYPAVNHTFILREVRQLRRLGFDLHVISISAADRPAENLTDEEQEELRRTSFIKPQGVRGAIKSHLTTLTSRPVAYLGGLAYALRLSKLDVRKMVAHLLYFIEAIMVGHLMAQRKLRHFHTHFSSTVGLITKRVFPVTMSITIHGPDEFNDVIGFHMREKVAASLFIFTISNYARSQIMKASDYDHWQKIEVMPLGVDLMVFSPRPFRENPAPFEVICVGRLAPAKAQQILIQATETLVKEGYDVRLRLVGDGPDRHRLEQYVTACKLSKHVVFEGALNQDRVRELYRQADIFALASFAEGVPVVLMEAMAMEIPCVATCITGIPELIRDGLDGLLVPPSDASALAEAIARLMDDANLRRRLGLAGRRRVLEKYDLTRNTERQARLFRQRIAKSAEPIR